jgi:hypothetical protein
MAVQCLQMQLQQLRRRGKHQLVRDTCLTHPFQWLVPAAAAAAAADVAALAAVASVAG